MPAHRDDEAVGPRGGPHPQPTADLLARYGELAAQLEDATDPEHTARLQAELDDLDGAITFLAATAPARDVEQTRHP